MYYCPQTGFLRRCKMEIISSDQLRFWLEADNALNETRLLMLLEQIANGDYTPKQLNASIAQFMLTGERK